MFGAILGDIIGSPFEGRRYSTKSKDFALLSKYSRITDDSIMTLAVAEGLMNSLGEDDNSVMASIAVSLKKIGRCYMGCGYGRAFKQWLFSNSYTPYNSYGNGSAMRVSSTAWLSDSLEEARRLARLSSAVTHNHIEGIRGAEATAAAIFLARKGVVKGDIKKYIESEFGYDLSISIDELRPGYGFSSKASETVPAAIRSFLDGTDFIDTIRNAVSLGGDADTLAAIAGSIAEAFYGVSDELKALATGYLDENLKSILNRYNSILIPGV